MFDLTNNVARSTLLAPVAAPYTATPAVLAFDTAGYKSIKISVLVGIGGIPFTNPNRLDLVCEHSDDGVTYALVTAADVYAIVTAPNVTGAVAAGGIVRSYQATAAAATNTDFGYRRTRRFVRVTPTFVGTHATGTPVVIVAMGGDPVLLAAPSVN
jgi:hypothetical protein